MGKSQDIIHFET